jgi:2-hydroxychromene-2-carboxylate isomerase
LFRSAWERELDIGQESILREILLSAGFDFDYLIMSSKRPQIKEILLKNTNDAIKLGIVGLPTIPVDDQIIWGQDNLSLVEDICLGWTIDSQKNTRIASKI